MYKFYRFIEFTEQDNTYRWEIKPPLQCSMENFQQQYPESKENFWVLYFHGLWQQQPNNIAWRHLWAYLQLACLHASKKIALVIRQQSQSVHNYDLRECFYTAGAEVNTVLKYFPSKGKISLEFYARKRFWTLLRDKLRELKIIYICTDWALLRSLKETFLIERLQECNYSHHIKTYVLAWESFREGYVPKPSKFRKLQEPSEEDWEKIAQIYRNKSNSQCELEEIKNLIFECVKCVRSTYQINSIPLLQLDESSKNQYDNLSYNRIGVEERTDGYYKKQSQIEAFLTKLLNNLDNEQRDILRLHYSENLTQVEISKELGIQQYTVSRRMKKAREILLNKLAKWLKDEMKLNLNQDALKELNIFINHWLENHYNPNEFKEE